MLFRLLKLEKAHLPLLVGHLGARLLQMRLNIDNPRIIIGLELGLIVLLLLFEAECA